MERDQQRSVRSRRVARSGELTTIRASETGRRGWSWVFVDVSLEEVDQPRIVLHTYTPGRLLPTAVYAGGDEFGSVGVKALRNVRVEIEGDPR